MPKVNLKAYAEAATLPPYKEKRYLTVHLTRKDPHALTLELRYFNVTVGCRSLRIMPRINRGDLSVKAKHYWELVFAERFMEYPVESLDEHLGIPIAEFFTVVRDGRNVFHHRNQKYYEVGTAGALLRLIERTVLCTASAILHVADGQTKAWTVSQEGSRTGGRDLDPMCLAKWKLWNNTRHDVRLAAVFLPPWQFSHADFADFIEGSTITLWFSQISTGSISKHDARPGELMWARIYDYCYSSDCHYWVVTSYDHWVFGIFSKNFMQGWTTELYHRDSTDPTVLQLVVFWMHSAFTAKNTWSIPQTPTEPEENPTDERPCHSGRLWASNPKAVMQLLASS
ncbi:hypothetical protein BD410DRAFT_790590 [Rickenella mellea]|uniref:Uncharacterized protein n=1 Tax=Rickenella mellea TaxID=50990 RepID=A0A4Y7PZX7_9AGAM|nr:hypothetical protein BD410DRAFT_790590 [Rickenella mellea]